MTSKLEVVNIECIRGNRSLFSGLNFSLQSGQLQYVEGKNGAGKTSLLRILTGLSLPESGQILWHGQDIRKDKEGYYRNLGYIGHSDGIKLDLSPLENLESYLALNVLNPYLDVETALDRVGLHEFRHQPCHTLSAGQCRRAAIARLFLGRTPLWILDEPMTGIDDSGAKTVEGILEEHLRDNGMIILTSHRPICKNIHWNRPIKI